MTPVIPRSAWGAEPPKYTPLPLRRVDGWHIHWLGDAYPDELTDTQILQSVQRYHQHAKQWNDIAYSFAIGRERPEAVYECRGFRAVGGHTEGHNSTSLGIVFLIGDGEKPSPAQLSTCARFIGTHHTSAGYIRPHSAAKATACPGPDLRRWIAAGLTTKETTMEPQGLVADIQRMLNANGVQPPLAVDGVAGPRTAAALDGVLRWLNSEIREARSEVDQLLSELQRVAQADWSQLINSIASIELALIQLKSISRQ
jgi:hypothetical protein